MPDLNENYFGGTLKSKFFCEGNTFRDEEGNILTRKDVLTAVTINAVTGFISGTLGQSCH